MNIIILPKVSEGQNCIHLNTYTLSVYLFLVLILILLIACGAYYLGLTAQSTTQRQYLDQIKISAKDWQTTLGRQQSMLVEGLNGLAKRVGHLQAEMDRVNVLGQRLITHAGLEKGEFNFRNPPAIGGPALSQSGSVVPKVNSFLATIGRLEQTVFDRQQQLSLLEVVLAERNRQQTTLPEGRPLRRGWLSSKYGYRTDPFSGLVAFHHGVDFAAKAGTKILATAAGIVTWSGGRAGYGNMVEIDHGNGYVTRYAHNQKNLVRVGDNVAKGRPIALVGSTGRSTGPHVHLEILHNGRTIDPLLLFAGAEKRVKKQ